MEKIKNFFTNYKSDILNALGVIALVAVVVVGAVLFFGHKNAEPDVAGTTAPEQVVTTEPEITTELTTEPTTEKAPVTTTNKAIERVTEAATKKQSSQPSQSNNQPVNNPQSNVEQGTLPAGLVHNCQPGDGLYEMNLATYNMDAQTMAAYNDAISRGVKPTRIYYKNGNYDDVVYTGWNMPYDEIVICKRCGKPTGGGTHGTCASSFNGHNCELCGEWIPAGGCHTCKY